MSQRDELDLEQVRHVAALARLALSDKELTAIESDLKAILAYVDLLASVDVEGVEPLATPHGHVNRLHDTQPEPPLARASILTNAPETEGDYLSVPKVLDGHDQA